MVENNMNSMKHKPWNYKKLKKTLLHTHLSTAKTNIAIYQVITKLAQLKYCQSSLALKSSLFC